MKIQTDALRQLMKALTMSVTDGNKKPLPAKRLQAKLTLIKQNLDEYRDGADLTDPGDAELLKAIIAAMDAGEEIEVTDDVATSPEAADGAAGKPSAKKKGKEQAAAEPAPKKGADETVSEKKVAASIAKLKGKKPAAKKAGDGKVRGCSVLGHSGRRVAHWMGKNGWTMEEARMVLSKLGTQPFSDVTLRSCLTDGKNPKYSQPAELSREEQQQLKKVVGK